MKCRSERLASEPLKKLIPSLALPMIISQCVTASYNLADRIFLGHAGNSALDLTAVGIVFPITLIVSAVAAVASGGAHLASISIGEGDEKKASDMCAASFIIIIAASIILPISILFAGDDILKIFGASEVTLKTANDYLSIYLLGTFPISLVSGMNIFVSSQGNTRKALLIAGTGSVLNLILDPIFIYMFGLGIKGAAIATVISQWAAALLLIDFLIYRSEIRLIPHRITDGRRYISEVASLGISPAILLLTESIINALFNWTLLKSGGDIAVAMMSIFASVMTFCYMPLTGFFQGCQPILSYNKGSGNTERIRNTFRIMIAVGLSYTILLVSIICLFPRGIISIFTSDILLIEYAASKIRIYFIGISVFGVQTAIQQTFLATGNKKISLVMALLRKVILLTPLVLIAYYTGGGVSRIIAAEPIADFISVSISMALGFIFLRPVLTSVKGGIS